jgi:hypothetical protein
LLRRFGTFSLLIAAVMKLLVRGLFLHAPIMSQIAANSHDNQTALLLRAVLTSHIADRL